MPNTTTPFPWLRFISYTTKRRMVVFVWLVNIQTCIMMTKQDPFVVIYNPCSFTWIWSSAGLSPFAEAFIRICPDPPVSAIMAVICPLKRCISGRWKASRQVGSPLAPALYFPFPLTEKTDKNSHGFPAGCREFFCWHPMHYMVCFV